jgi:hypothetical protein
VFAPTAVATIATATKVNSRAFKRERIAYRIRFQGKRRQAPDLIRCALRHLLARVKSIGTALWGRSDVPRAWADQLT